MDLEVGRNRICPQNSRFQARTLLRTLQSMSRHSATACFRYVYLLESHAPEGGFYTGMTDDLTERLAAHNAGMVSSSRRGRPWGIRVAIAFRDPVRAAKFEQYLKSGSGRAFAIRHF